MTTSILGTDQYESIKNKEDHRHLEAAFTAAYFRRVFRGHVDAMHIGTCLVVKVDDHLSEQYSIARLAHQGPSGE